VRSVSLVVPVELAEVVADELWSLGAVAVEERAVESGVMLVTSFCDDGATEQAVAALAGRFAVTVEDVDESVYDTWRAFAELVRVGERLAIEPAWLASRAGPADVVVRIDPGRAFGSGAHATTILVLESIERLVRPGDSVLDVGCGSGVLGIAAAVLGAGRVVGVDIDDEALVATATNAKANGVTVEVARSIPDGEVFDVVVANLLAPILVELAPTLVVATAATGTLVVSGVLAGRFEHVLAALAPLRAGRTLERDGWAVIELGLPSGTRVRPSGAGP
jgi:ribosomal protein L11 methyltransferase